MYTQTCYFGVSYIETYVDKHILVSSITLHTYLQSTKPAIYLAYNDVYSRKLQQHFSLNQRNGLDSSVEAVSVIWNSPYST